MLLKKNNQKADLKKVIINVIINTLKGVKYEK